MLFISSPSKGAISEVTRNKPIKRVDALLRKPPAIFVVLAVLLALSIGVPTDLHAQSSPSISIELSPAHSVPQNTAITGTITLDNLDLDSYSSLIFRADPTIFDANPKYHAPAANCEGEDMGRDITIDVDESRETFTVSVYKPCPDRILVYYTLDVSISRVDTSLPDGKVELASASTRFSMTRYLTPGETPSTPPTPETAAWMDPDPTTFDWYVGEWVRFRARTNVLLYLNDHVGVRGYGHDSGHFVGRGQTRPSITVEEYCEQEGDRGVNFRRAIHQGLWIGACEAGVGFLAVRHETDAVPPLYLYEVHILARDENRAPDFDEGSSADRSVAENASTGQEVGAPITAADDDDDALTYTLSGDDAGLFSIESETGQIKVGAGTVLDYETQTGYSVTVSVHDGKDANGNTDTTIDTTIDVAISIDNIDEPGAVSLSSTQPQVGVELTARLTDPDGSVTGISWQWAYSSDGSANWTDIGGAMSAAYTPVAAGEGKYLRATASYTDGHGAGKKASAAADNATIVDGTTIPPPSTIADAPENLRATAGNAEVTLRWDASSNDGGADITGYAYRYKESGGVLTAYTDIPESGPGQANARSYTVTGLTNGLEYVFHVHAVNEHGEGLPADVTVMLPTRVNTESEELPTEVTLSTNYPNPFNPETTIRYALPQAGNVRLAVYDMTGKTVAVLLDGIQPQGRHTARFHLEGLPTGTYIYRLTAGAETLTRTMTLVR